MLSTLQTKICSTAFKVCFQLQPAPLHNGLVGAAHLNGREGVTLRTDPNNAARVIVRLADGGNEVRSPLRRLSLVCFQLAALCSNSLPPRVFSCLTCHLPASPPVHHAGKRQAGLLPAHLARWPLPLSTCTGTFNASLSVLIR